MSTDWALIGAVATALVPVVAVVTAWVLKELSTRNRQERERVHRIQPLINRSTVRLTEIEKVVERLAGDEWTQAYRAYEAIPSPDRLVEFSEEAAAISPRSHLHARKLVCALEAFRTRVDHLQAEARERALAIQGRVAPPRAEDDNYGEFMYVSYNQEFHAWREGRELIEEELWALSRELERFAHDDARTLSQQLRSHLG